MADKKVIGNFVLERDVVINGNLIVDGSIVGKKGGQYTLKVNGDISARNISARNISANNILAEDITSWDISAKNIISLDISATNIKSGNISARNIIAKDVSAGDIFAKDILANNISAGDISYYALCFAYHDIECTSIKGRRKNSRYFVLDGKITILK